jgi:hypothetical protein
MEIVRTKGYSRDMKKLGASDADMLRVETEIATDPTVGDVIPGLGGLRKVRFRFGNRGKRGGGRAIYFLMVSADTAVMVFAYAKSTQEDLTSDERAAAKRLMEDWIDG